MNGCLVCSGTGKTKNIGDYIQSLAQEQYLNDYCYIEREHMDSFASEKKVKVVMNGWFMTNPQNFPPSSSIIPLFTSFHIAPRVENFFFTQQTIEYLKKHEPVGARDLGTKRMLDKHNIKSYFSGCLTLTLGKKYKSNIKNNNIIFVDPIYEFSMGNDLLAFVKNLYHMVRLFHKTNKLKKNFVFEDNIPPNRIKAFIKKTFWLTSFYRSYSSLFSDSTLFNALYLTHKIPQSNFNGNDDKMDFARKRMELYARAKLVVTSRIHCALPCLGIETPVIFVTSEKLENGHRSVGRFEGIIDMMNTVRYTEDGLVPISKNLVDMVEIEKHNKLDKYIPANPKVYEYYRDQLDSQVSSFLSSINN